MKPDRFFALLQNIDETLVSRAGRRRKRIKPAVIRAVALCACLVLAVTGALHFARLPHDNNIPNIPDIPDIPITVTPDRESKFTVTPLSTAVYPASDRPEPNGQPDNEYYDALWQWTRSRPKSVNDSAHAEFVKKTSIPILQNKNGENTVYSPAGLYMTLSVLSEVSGGTSREQILSLIGRQSVTEVRDNVSTLWNKLYRDDSQQQSWLANSLWLSDEYNFDADTLEILRDNYYASAFSGVFGDKSLDDAYIEWLSTQTDGMLADTVQNKQLDPGHAAYIASTLYFNAQWENMYREENTEDGIFHGQKGDVTVPFMSCSQLGKDYYYCKDYAAISNPLAEGGEVIFILPDKDKSVDDVLKDSKALNGDLSHLDVKNTKVNYSVPKLDISTDCDLADTLAELGVTDIFNAKTSDMSPLCKEYPLFVTAVEHATRITVNEKGIRAAALGEVSLKAGAAPPKDEVDFVLDRPFVMVVTGADNLPRFIAAIRSL